MKALSAVLTVLLSACAISTNYVGSDAGHAVIGIGAVLDSPYTSHVFIFRRVGETATGRLVYFTQPVLLVSRPPDYKTSDEAGIVELATVPAGKYELIQVESAINLGIGTSTFSSRRPFSIPFEIRPGEVVYVGNYQANPIRHRSDSGSLVAGGAFFVVEDRSQSDLALAKARLPSLVIERARNLTPDADAIGTPLFVPVAKAALAREKANSAGR
jgi:hypothetical protein